MPAPGRHCADIIESRHPDVLEMDAASNTGIDNIREIIESARYKPLVARYKVFIIDEVHMLSKGAFNALLKTLEEPPEHVKFIFATTEIRKVPVTVLSRCQRFDLRRVDVPVLSAHFKRIVGNENAKAADDALALIARAAEGSVRDGLSILDQAIAFSPGEVTADNVRAMLGLADRGRIFDLLDDLFKGATAPALAALTALHHDGADAARILGRSRGRGARHDAGQGCGSGGGRRGPVGGRKAAGFRAGVETLRPLLSRAWQMLLKGLEEAVRAPNPLAAAEMVLIRIAHTADLPSPDEIIKALGGGSVARKAQNGGAAHASAGDGEARASGAATPIARSQGSSQEPPAASPDDYGNAGADWLEAPESEYADPGDDIGPAVAAVQQRPDPKSFAEVVALAGQMRDPRLKLNLEDRVSLVKFDAMAGSIDMFLMPGALPEIANELREKLNKWTGRRWVILLSKAAGDKPLGEVRREREAAELEELKRHPAVAALLAEFPDAKVAEVRALLTPPENEESATG